MENGENRRENRGRGRRGRGRGNRRSTNNRERRNTTTSGQNHRFDFGQNLGSTHNQGNARWRGIGYQKLLEWSLMTDDDDLLMGLMTSKNELLTLLTNDAINDDWVYLMIKIFENISTCNRNQNKIAILALLRDSQFIKRHIGEKLLVWNIEGVLKKNNEMAKSLLVVFKHFLTLFPSSFGDVPLDAFKTFLVDLDKQEYDIEIQDLIETRKEIVTKIMASRNKTTADIIEEKPPPEDFRQIDTIPTNEDIYLTEDPYLRPIKKNGSYENGDHYLDVQFRLLREDLVRPLRDGIHEIVNDVPKNMKKSALKLYYNIHILYPICTRHGMTYLISFDTVHTKGIPWQHSRRLIFGSLLCFSKDQFQTFVFATVANRDPKELVKGMFSIRFERNSDVDYFKTKQPIEMVESSTYFEAYKHVLDGIKELDGDSIPMSNYIVECNSNVDHPDYIRNRARLEYELKDSLKISDGLKSKVEILKNKSWPLYQETELNESQLQAFRHALTKEFVVIQGPPGTGKTHVGLKIAHALLQNKVNWKEDKRNPMLVVCYTNHALDQFLTGLIALGHTNLIRVGGRSSEELKQFSLRNEVRRTMQFNKTAKRNEQDETFKEVKKIRRAKHIPFMEREQFIEEINGTYEKSRNVHDTLQEGKFIHFDKLQYVMDDFHRQCLEQYDFACKPLGISVFDIFLEIVKLPPGELYNIRTVEEEGNIENIDKLVTDDQGFNAIDVIGEGQALTDRWVTDENLYQDSFSKKKKQYQGENKEKKNSHFIDKDGFQYQKPSKYTRKRAFKANYGKHEEILEENIQINRNPWQLSLQNRWKLYKFWLQKYSDIDQEELLMKQEMFEDVCRQVTEFDQLEDAQILKNAEVIAMTTSGAARSRHILRDIQPAIVIVEEAAEVLEAHVLTSLSSEIKHLILIGDHKQLKPNPSVYSLAKNYGLEVSLFQRMVNNGMDCHTLDIQHRMRPEISRLLRHIYPKLVDHDTVKEYPNIKGVNKNLMFINHQEKESEMEHMKSKANLHEALYLRSLCLYLIQQGYEPSQITILSGYAGQIIQLKNVMPKDIFEGVRVTAVDNYQGEENDIILLSLVRSNNAKNIGFLSIDNRICVSLSRAKQGLYVIGNFDLMVEKSDMWKRIVLDAKAMGSYGNYLELCCQNHPVEKIKACVPNDFLQAPEGGCIKPCEFRLNCGHVCEKACHPVDPLHEEYICKKKCSKKTCEENHKCPKRCHYNKPCGDCRTRVEKILHPCNHKQMVMCYEDPTTVKCVNTCEKILSCGHKCQNICSELCSTKLCQQKVLKILPCLHESYVECSKDVKDAWCNTPCKVILGCEHNCTGTCSGCKQGRLHKRCSTKCERTLPCAHLCKESCTKSCPPCNINCENRCTHSRCNKKCGVECAPCMEKCSWKCLHNECKKLCFETCDRGPCNEPCNRVIQKCGHPCIGLCGEPCPKLCRVCDKEEVEEIFFGNEDEPNALFIVLEDCKHIFEIEGLDTWMGQKDTNDEIQFKKCPKCKVVIRRSVRYGNIIKRILKDIEEIKLKIMVGENLLEAKDDAYMKCRKLNDVLLAKNKIGTDIDSLTKLVDNVTLADFIKQKYKQNKDDVKSFTLAYRLKNGGIDVARRIDNQANLLLSIEKTFKQGHTKNLERKDEQNILRDVGYLKKYIMHENINEDQFNDAVEELRRLKLYWDIITTTASLKDNKEFQKDYIKQFAAITKMFKTGSKVKSERIELFCDYLSKIKKKFNVNELSKEEKEMVVKAMGFTKGHWYKCPNGHFYCIGECGGATETAKCPECKQVVGGTGHRLAPGNQHAGEFDHSNYASYSEEANNPLNWDQNQLAALRL